MFWKPVKYTIVLLYVLIELEWWEYIKRIVIKTNSL